MDERGGGDKMSGIRVGTAGHATASHHRVAKLVRQG